MLVVVSKGVSKCCAQEIVGSGLLSRIVHIVFISMILYHDLLSIEIQLHHTSFINCSFCVHIGITSTILILLLTIY